MAGKTVKNNSLGMILLKGRTFIALIILVIFFSFCAPNFTTANSIVLMLRHTSLYGLLALGMTLVIITGGIDLSVGSVVGLVGMLMGGMLNEGLRLPFMSGTLYPNVPLILLIVAVVAILIGLVSGLLIAYLNVPAFIATLGTMYVCRGFAMLRNGGATFPNLLGSEELGNLGFPTIGSGSITVFGLDIPYAILIFVVLALLSLFILKFTSLGNQIYAVGGNERAATLSGIKTKRIKLFVYMFSALLAAICSMINTSQLRAAHPAVFENRFPSMVRVPGRSEAVEYVNGNPLWEKKLAAGRCEVICFDPDENGLPADLPVSRLRTVVEAWAFRTAEISKMEGIEQIFPFENHGQEIGVSLAHPHGQVYCYPFIAPKMEAELKQTEAYHEKTGGNLLKDLMNSEIEAGERIVMRNHSWVAYVPAAARWPLEVHVAPVRDVLTLDELNDQERWDLAVMYSTLLKRGNAFFDKGDGKGMDLPYIAAWHQAPIHDVRRENYRLNLQFFSFRRAANKIKYLAGSESGMAAWVSDTTPELIAKRFHELGPIDIEG